MKTALLDTNVLIALEDTGRMLGDQQAVFLRESRGFLDFYVHPIQEADILEDANVQRRNLLLARVKQFKLLSSPPKSDEGYFEEMGWANKSHNDFIDNNLLLCVVEPVVDYLITEDKGILRKAERANVRDRVFTVDEFLAHMSPVDEDKGLVYVNEECCHELDLSASFFDSLREDYGSESFDSWFQDKCCRGQRRCWTIRTIDRELRALCIYKEETSSIIDDSGFRPSGKKVLKLCTFKVDESIRGTKAGERLLYKAFQYSKTRVIDFCYFTTKPEKQPHLVELARRFGFEELGRDVATGDRVFGKYLRPQSSSDFCLDKELFFKKFYPSFKRDSSVCKYLVPIIPRFHERLFPDIADFRMSLFADDVSFYQTESFTIRKAYICHSNIRTIEPGDILLFYRTHDRQSVEAYGIVASAVRSGCLKTINDLVRSRTVYDESELRSMISDGRDGVLAICFDLIGYLPEPVSLEKLRNLGLSHPQSIMGITDEQYDKIMECGKWV